MKIQERHGDTSRKNGSTRLYRIWCNMKNRCQNSGTSNDPKYEYYKHITVCDEWQRYIAFKEWAINNGYKDGLSIDRIDVNSGYNQSNCRWADRSVQARNIRIQKNNKSGFRGVRFRKDTNKYNAFVYYNKKNKSLGCFDTAEEAAMVRDKYVIENNIGSPLNF
jgi:hypothetical protein